jgi:hypothetical protein
MASRGFQTRAGCTDGSRLAVVRMDAFEVGKHDITIERVSMLRPGVLHYSVRYYVLVVAHEVAAASRARLLVGHGRMMPDPAPPAPTTQSGSYGVRFWNVRLRGMQTSPKTMV